MRAFWISLVLFLLMLLLVAGSMVMNRHVSFRMRSMVEALPDVPSEGETDELEAFWHTWRSLMRLTMNQTVWRSVNDLTASLAAYATLGKEGVPEYVGARRQLLCAIEEMSRPEWAAHATSKIQKKIDQCGDLPGKSQHVDNPEIPVLGLVAVHLHAEQSADGAAEKAEAEQNAFLGTPAAALGFTLVKTVGKEGHQADGGHGNQKNQIGGHHNTLLSIARYWGTVNSIPHFACFVNTPLRRGGVIFQKDVDTSTRM